MTFARDIFTTLDDVGHCIREPKCITNFETSMVMAKDVWIHMDMVDLGNKECIEIMGKWGEKYNKRSRL